MCALHWLGKHRSAPTELAYADVSAKGGERRQPRIDEGGGAPTDSCEWSEMPSAGFLGL